MLNIRGFLGSEKKDGPYLRNPSRMAGGRVNNPSILIREITVDDSKNVCKLLFDHFRSLTIPAIVYWMVQHIHDIIAIVVINSFLLPFRNLVYFCLLFLVYLFVRARYEIENHIKHCCPDLVDVYKTYRTTKASNFWVAYFTDKIANTPSIGSQTSSITPSGQVSIQSMPSISPGDVRSTNIAEQTLTPTHSISENSSPNGNKVPKDDIIIDKKCKNNEILGCIGITPYRNRSNIAQMVRLVVSKKCRNMKVGTRLLNHLEQHALDSGYTEIRVFTNNLNTAYLHFLKQNGFEIIQIVRRGLMRGDLIIWNKVLKQSDYLITDGNSTKVGDACFIPE
ncbi:acetyltransferase, GNAT family domain-containing protein [Theileria equi strain WA]|uniref:Acetyltransferase, GNAT family domain-containing protein n=1 Tax=Theileria equi strain WA TaxID=1537102 RepID=L0B138_THEEQ|nr:acetyltransferase, GNAT family domain-containing protein [Theileria equi strain WA]AFZ81535.1 acetyltransferase, GNAT family domain-containing protein [Theileria equi strain WA]|eukprot:XP_004831201.1 acetyltransferase, GNAT family domain-containing protein [Theileria equi strain WA]